MFQLGHFFSEMDSLVSPDTLGGDREFQLGHFFSEMDRGQQPLVEEEKPIEFQLGHFFSEMDRAAIFGPLLLSK